MEYMLTADEEKIANEWKKYEGYTVRPLPCTVSYYRQLIAHHAASKQCMMYGGTPEIRSLFQEKGLPVTICDQSEIIVRSMGRLTLKTQAISENEIFYQSNWISEQLYAERQYDFLIGDDAINMVNWTDFDKFLKNANKLLNKKGIFVCHLLVKPDEYLINQSFNQIYDEYHSGIIKSSFDLASRLNFICYDYKSYAMGWQQTINRLGADALNKFKPDFDFIDTFGYCNSKFYCPPQLAFESIANKYFTVKEIFYPDEHHYCLFEPIYVLQKK